MIPQHLALDASGAVVADEGGDDDPDVLDRATGVLSGLTRRIADELGTSTDVEGALDDGGLTVLQARPTLIAG